MALLNTKDSEQIQEVNNVMKDFLANKTNLKFGSQLLEKVIQLPKTFDAALEADISRERARRFRFRAKLYRKRLEKGFVYPADSDVLHLMSKNQKKKSLYRTID